MATILVRKLEDWVVEAFRDRARRNGHGLEAELRQFLRDEITNSREKLVDQLENQIHDMEAKHGLLSDSAKGIREDRDGRR